MRNTETAYFAMGCFWGAERLFSGLDGVQQTEVGYMGGHLENPSYQQVCTDTTGHAETVRVVFDSAQISYRQLLEVFFSHHNPTTRNRQGGDVGSQYRSQIFPTTADQEHTAQAVLLKLKTKSATSTEPSQLPKSLAPPSFPSFTRQRTTINAT